MSAASKPKPYRLSGKDRIIYKRVEMSLARTEDSGFVVYELERQEVEHLIKFDDITTLVDAGDLQIDYDHYSVDKALRKVDRRLGALDELDAKKLADIEYKFELCLTVRTLLEQLPLTTKERRKTAIDKAHRDLQNRHLKSSRPSEIAKKDRIPLSTFDYWNGLLMAADDNPRALMDARPGNTSVRFSSEIEDLIQKVLDEHYLIEQAKSVQATYPFFKFAATALNAERRAAGLERFKIPSLKTFGRRVKDIDDFLKRATRQGIEEADHAHRVITGGQSTFRPGGRTEVDGWRIHLHVLLEGTDAWADLTEKERAELSTVRVTIVVAIDVATRCIVSLGFGWSETEDLVRRVIRMSMEDKTELAKAFGCTATWSMRGGDSFVSDNGTALTANAVTEDLLKVYLNRQKSPPGVPWLRGYIERWFRTVASQLIAMFTGQTGSNVKDRTSYQTPSRASITYRELVGLMVHWVVEVYHRKKHKGLGDVTPQQAWYLLSKEYPPRIPMSPVQLAEIYGHQETRNVGSHGLDVLGTYYQSASIMAMREELGDGAELTVKIDYEDLRQILVKVPDRLRRRGILKDPWISVPGPTKLPRRSLRLLEMVDDDLATRFGYDTVASAAGHDIAIQSIHAHSKNAAIARLTEPSVTREAVAKHRKKKLHTLTRFGTGRFTDAQVDAILAPIALPGPALPKARHDEPGSSIPIIFKD